MPAVPVQAAPAAEATAQTPAAPPAKDMGPAVKE
jgi:hypothetical protein